MSFTPGSAPLFTQDPRPSWAVAGVHGDRTNLNGLEVLELGPLEGAHTYQLEKAGANVTAIDSNAEAYLKCLIVKDMFGMRSRFIFGNFLEYMKLRPKKFDLLFASGVLYHMTQPLALIKLICETADESFIWSHYYDADVCQNFSAETSELDGLGAPHYRRDYGDRSYGKFWGGLADSACWLAKDDILRAFRHFGHREVKVVDEQIDHPAGPCFSIITAK